MPRRIAIIQARMSSTRLPGKVLMPLLGLPAIVFMVQRVRQAQLLDGLVVAISDHASDDQLEAVLKQHHIDVFRGELSDVLDRFYQAALSMDAGHVVRLTGDCPLMDADLIDRALSELKTQNSDYVCNTSPPSYPDGLDVEAFTFELLSRTWQHAKLPSQREHVTPYMRSGLQDVKVANWCALSDASALRWTIDHLDDHEHVTRLLAHVGATYPTSFDRFDLYRAIETFGLQANSEHVRNEGYLKSLAADRIPPASTT